MSTALLIPIAAVLLAGIIIVRCICVLNLMHCSQRSHYAFFVAFGVAYITLAISALGAAIDVIESRANWPTWGFLISSVALIAFDRRRPECFDQHQPCDAPPAGGHA